MDSNFDVLIHQDILNMAAPDVTNELTGAIVISSEEGETDDVEDKFMADLGMGHNARLMCDDFLQNFQLVSSSLQLRHVVTFA